MTEIENATQLPEKPSRFRVRSPKIRDAKNFVGALASADLGEDTLALVNDGNNQAAVVMAIKNAVATPLALDKMMYVLVDLWEYDPPDSVVNADEPPEEWDYDPPLSLVERGQAISREEQWRSFSRRHRVRLVKKLELEDEGLEAIEEFADAVQRLPYVKDFLERARRSAEDDSGGSTTGSNNDTGESPTPG